MVVQPSFLTLLYEAVFFFLCNLSKKEVDFPMKTILIVEDDISLNKGIMLTLARDGIAIRQAYDLAAANKLLLEEPIDLIILDVNLPDQRPGFL